MSVGEKNNQLQSAYDAEVQSIEDVLGGGDKDTDARHDQIPEYPIPEDVASDIKKHKAELEELVDFYSQQENDKGNRGKREFYMKCCEALCTIEEYLDGSEEGFKKAAHFITTLMSTMQHQMPPSLWGFLSKGRVQTKSLKDYYTEVK